MREIDNKNINSLNFKGIQKPATESTPVSEVPATPAETKEIKDLANMPAAAIGQSQVQASSDNTESDMLFLLKNPAEVEQLNNVFDKFQENHSYEEAVQLLDAYRHEFYVKK